MPLRHDEELLRIVEEASAHAAQKIAAIHRRRLVAQSFLGALVAAVLISIPISIVLSDQRKVDARRNALYNCRVLTRVAEVMGSGNLHDLKLNGEPAGFLSSDANLRHAQQLNAQKIQALRPGALKALLTDPETLRLQRRNVLIDKQTTSYWKNVLGPDLASAAKTNCKAAIH